VTVARSRPPHATRRHAHRRLPARRKGHWLFRLGVAGAAAVALLILWAVVARNFAPDSNTSIDHFDAMIILGDPANSDGNPSPAQLSRVTEGVREYERGVAPRLILTGGATHNRFVEGQVMAKVAEAQGIPDSAIYVEGQAKDTIQNVCYSARIMKAHGWRSAEVISSARQLPRAAIMLGHLPLDWRTHAAPALEPISPAEFDFLATIETLKTARYLAWARWTEPCTP
jgi:uncharacterized SAM-binding protein YcdF (DUF218 family)